MRGILGVVLAVGLLAGCGGVEEAQVEQDVAAQALSPCLRQCLAAYNACMDYGYGTPEECQAEWHECDASCRQETGGRENQAMALPACSRYDGAPCPTHEESFACWHPGDVPGRCVCTTQHIWRCS